MEKKEKTHETETQYIFQQTVFRLRSRTEAKAFSRIKCCLPLFALILLFAALIILMVPEGAVFRFPYRLAEPACYSGRNNP